MEGDSAAARLDPMGSLTFAGSLGYLIWAMIDANQVGWIVQRSQGDACLDTLNHFIGDHHGGGEFFTTVHYAMANGKQVVVEFRVFGQDLVYDEAHGLFVGSTGSEVSSIFLTVKFPFDPGIIQVQAFCQPREFFFAAGGINHGEFEG